MYSRWPPKWPIYTPSNIFCCLQPTVFIVLVLNFHICLYLISSCKYVNFTYLHIPKKRILLSAVHYFHCMDINSSYISPLDLSTLKYANFVHLHIQYGWQNWRNMLLTAYFYICIPPFLRRRFLIFIYTSAWNIPLKM